MINYFRSLTAILEVANNYLQTKLCTASTGFEPKTYAMQGLYRCSNHWAMKSFMVGRSTVSSNHWVMKSFMVGRSIVSSNHWAMKPFIVGRSIVSSNHWAMKPFMVGRLIVSSNHWVMKPFMVYRSLLSYNKPVLVLKVWNIFIYELRWRMDLLNELIGTQPLLQGHLTCAFFSYCSYRLHLPEDMDSSPVLLLSMHQTLLKCLTDQHEL